MYFVWKSMKFIVMLALTFGAASAILTIVRRYGWPYWAYHALALTTGVILYLIHNILMVGFIRKRAPDFASKEEILPGVQRWELTAGTGIVPKWVSLIGLLSIAFVLASPFELLAWLMRAVGR